MIKCRLACACGQWQHLRHASPLCAEKSVKVVSHACREYMQPGYDAMGFISCTGTNFLVRSARCDSSQTLTSFYLPC